MPLDATTLRALELIRERDPAAAAAWEKLIEGRDLLQPKPQLLAPRPAATPLPTPMPTPAPRPATAPVPQPQPTPMAPGLPTIGRTPLSGEEVVQFEGAPGEPAIVKQHPVLGRLAEAVVEDPISMAVAGAGAEAKIAAAAGKPLVGAIARGGLGGLTGGASELPSLFSGFARFALRQARKEIRPAISKGLQEGVTEVLTGRPAAAQPEGLRTLDIPRELDEQAAELIAKRVKFLEEQGLPQPAAQPTKITLETRKVPYGLAPSRYLDPVASKEAEQATRQFKRMSREEAIKFVFGNPAERRYVERLVNQARERARMLPVEKAAELQLVPKTQIWKGRKAQSVADKMMPPDGPLPGPRDAAAVKRGDLWSAMGRLLVNGREVANRVGGTMAKHFDALDEYRFLSQRASARREKQFEKIVRPILRNPDAQRQVVDVLRGKAEPANPLVEGVARKLRGLLNELADEAMNAGIEVIIRDPDSHKIVARAPFVPIRDYYPLFLKREATSGTGRLAFQDKFIQGLVSRAQSQGKEISEEQARKIFHFLMDDAPRRFGSLEYHRVTNLPDEAYTLDLLNDVPRYITRHSERLAQTKLWGQGNERLDEAYSAIYREAGSQARDYSRTITERVLGTQERAKSYEEIIEAVRAVQIVTKMGQSALLNATQPTFTAYLTDVRSTAKAIQQLMLDYSSVEEFAADAGILVDSVTQSALDLASTQWGTAGTNVATTFLRWNQFMRTEGWNRLIAAKTAQIYYPKIFRRLQRLGLDSRAGQRFARSFEAVRFSRDKLAAALRRGYLSDDDMQRLAFGLVQETQFPFDPTRLPSAFTHPVGRLAMQFKSFAFRAADRITRDVLREASHGNFRPLGKLVGVFMPVGAGTSWVLDKLRSKNRAERSAAVNAIRFMATVGAFGIYSDIIVSATFGGEFLAEQLTGPAVKDLGDIISAAVKTAQEGRVPTAAKRRALRAVPIIGPSLAPRVLPSQQGTAGPLGNLPGVQGMPGLAGVP